MYYSSELTLSKGYKYFVILSGGTNTSSHIVQTPTTVHTQSSGSFQGHGFGNTSFYGNNASTNYNFSGYGNSNSNTTITPGSQYVITRYKTGITIKMIHSKKDYPKALDAAVILSNFQQ